MKNNHISQDKPSFAPSSAPDNGEGIDARRKVIAKVTKCLSVCACAGEYYVELLNGTFVIQCFCDCHTGSAGR